MSPEHDGGAPNTARRGRTIGVVLAGGGARGAYEVGALSVLLPELAAQGDRVSVIVGTSVGALNGAWLASNIHRPVTELVASADELWRTLRWKDVVARLRSPRTLTPLIRYLGEILGGHVRVESLLDSSPLRATVDERLDTIQLQKNVRSGLLHAAAVVATSTANGESVVFHSGGGRVKHDQFRGIYYEPVELAAQHVLASAAIPSVFRAVKVTSPEHAHGWYVDGGTRLNTPLKPALKLGADHVIVVGLNSTRARRRHAVAEGADGEPPDIFQGAGELSQAILADPLAHDVRTLAMINTWAAGGHDPDHDLIPYVLVAPRVRDRIGEIASEVYAEHYASVRKLSTSVGFLGHLVRAGSGPANGELLSYLFFAPEFAEALIAEGAADARRWLSHPHDDGIWQYGPVDGPVRVAGSSAPQASGSASERTEP